MQEAFDWNEEPPLDPAIEYQGLLRGLRRKKGFGLYFVQCSPSEGTRLIERIRQDLPQKIEVLKFDAAMDGNFYQCVADYLQAHSDTEVLFVQGLEYSLLSYEATKREEGWSSEEIYSYSWKAVPRLLGNLNLQRERFRDNFPIRFVFLLPLFAMKYLIRRAPDFFDWRSGIYEFPTDSETLNQESSQLLGHYDEYLTWTQTKRDSRIAELQCWASEPEQPTEGKAQLFLEQGSLFFASEQYERAIASYDEALKHQPNQDGAWNNRGIALGKLERYEEAIASYDEALRINPDDDVWHKRGLAFAELEQYTEEIDSYNQALAVNPNNDWVLNSRGYALFELNRCQEAIADFDQAIRLDPTNDFPWSNRGAAFLSLGKFDEAFSSFERALNLNPQSNNVWYDQGVALNTLRRYEEAIASYDQALELKPDDYAAWNNRGTALHSLGRYEEAIASFDQALKFKPDHARTYYNKACCYGLQGQIELAIATLKQAIDLNPKCREMAKTDVDFEGVRSDDRFQAFLRD